MNQPQECLDPTLPHYGDVQQAKHRLLLLATMAFSLITMMSATRIVAGDATTQPAEKPSFIGWVTPKVFDHLVPHPRLFVSQDQIDRMVKGRGLEYEADYAAVAAAADMGVRDSDHPLQKESALGRSFSMLGRLLSLSVQWHRTGDRRYLEAAVRNIEAMASWMPPEAEIQLWQGQQIGAVAMTYDLLYNDLTPDQRTRVVAFARGHCIEPFRRVTGDRENPMVQGEHGTWWQGVISNWNPVCVCGAGMLALAMYEDLPEAQTVVDRVQNSLQPVFDYLQKTEGGWVEGLDYWNWTVHYMSVFMISYERSTGRDHPGFRSTGFGQTLLFGMHFVPYDEACGFGDNQHGRISSSLLEAADYLGRSDAVRQLQDYQARYAHYAELKRQRLAAATSHPVGEPADSTTTKPANIGYDQPLRLLINPDARTDIPPEPVRHD